MAESGYLSEAQSFIMTDQYYAQIESRDYLPEASDFQFDLNEALKSGAYVCGTTGSGKSDIGMYIAEKVMQQGIIVIVFDSSQDWQSRSNVSRFRTLAIPYVNEVPVDSVIFDISKLAVRGRQKLVESFS